MARIGKTQGIRFRISPPSKPPSSANHKLLAAALDVATGAAPAGAAFLARAAASSGDTCATAAACHWPLMGATVRQAMALSTGVWSAVVSTRGRSAGVSPRASDSGTVAVQTSPCHCCVKSLPASMAWCKVLALSLSTCRFWFCKAAGRPLTRNCSVAPSTLALLSPRNATGSCACAWAKSAANMPVLLLTGMLRLNWPLSGMHSTRHTSQVACSCTVALPLLAAKVVGTCTLTGSSTLPS